jgi:hypothetical protein
MRSSNSLQELQSVAVETEIKKIKKKLTTTTTKNKQKKTERL